MYEWASPVKPISKEVAESIGRVIPVALLALYVVGFIISTQYYAGLALPSPDLLQTRFLGAGILFLMLYAMPSAAIAFLVVRSTYLGFVSVQRRVAARNTSEPKSSSETPDPADAEAEASPMNESTVSPDSSGTEPGIRSLLLISVAGVIFDGWGRVMAMISTQGGTGSHMYLPTSMPGQALWLGVLASGLGWWAVSIRNPYVAPMYKIDLPYVGAVVRLVGGAPILFLALTTFAGHIYPRVLPAFGGGAATRGKLRLQDSVQEAVLAQLEKGSARREDWLAVAVIDRAHSLLTFAVCARVGVHVITVPEGSVMGVTSFNTFVTLPAFREDQCPHETKMF